MSNRSVMWAPKPFRHLFEDAMFGERCVRRCPPKLVIISGIAWVASCPITTNPDACGVSGGGASTLFALGSLANLPRAALRLPLKTPNSAVFEEIFASAQPLPRRIGSSVCNRIDVAIAKGIGVNEWRWFRVGTAIALLGLADDKPTAMIAINANDLQKFERAIRSESMVSPCP